MDKLIDIEYTEEFSVIFQNKLPPKLKDLGSFLIPCVMGDVAISQALYDLGASMSLRPYCICKRLQVGSLKAHTILIQLMDCSVKYPMATHKNVSSNGEVFHML